MKSMKPHGAGNEVYTWLTYLVPELADKVSPPQKGKNFDGPAKKTVGELLRNQLKNLDSKLDPKRDVHIEGEGTAPWMGKKRGFMKSGCYPDIGLQLLDKTRVAIEVDHGFTGAQVRNALTKGSFNVDVGDWQECYVLFFDERADNLLRATKDGDFTGLSQEYCTTTRNATKHG